MAVLVLLLSATILTHVAISCALFSRIGSNGSTLDIAPTSTCESHLLVCLTIEKSIEDEREKEKQGGEGHVLE